MSLGMIILGATWQEGTWHACSSESRGQGAPSERKTHGKDVSHSKNVQRYVWAMCVAHDHLPFEGSTSTVRE